LDEKIDCLEDLTTGIGACDEASGLTLASAGELVVSEKVLEEHVRHIDAD
jgi:hypothetical protein